MIIEIFYYCIYMNNFIFTDNNPSSSLVKEFKNSILYEFEMTNTGLVSAYLSQEVKQGEIYIHFSRKLRKRSFWRNLKCFIIIQ